MMGFDGSMNRPGLPPDVPIDVIHEEVGPCQCQGPLVVGCCAAGGCGVGGVAPVIHSAARCGPVCAVRSSGAQSRGRPSREREVRQTCELARGVVGIVV